MWTLCDNTYNLVQAERTFAASIIICQDAGIAIEKETVDLHLGTCDWCEDVFFFTKMTFREMSLFMSSIAHIYIIAVPYSTYRIHSEKICFY